jgi:NhaP-type Na+/H+ or K+/H+ antiporter
MIGMGFAGGQVVSRLGIPPLLGMMGVGILSGQFIAPEVLATADLVRVVAVTVILMKAGLGLDPQKVKQQGSVALRLGFLPALFEMGVVALAATKILKMDWQQGLLLGSILGAESPAVIVPAMLRLKSLGWGVTKGIPDAILTGSALSDVVLFVLFSLLLTTGQKALFSLYQVPLQVGLQIGLGVGLGYAAARGLQFLLTRLNWTQNTGQDTLVAMCVALSLVVGSQSWPYFSGYVGVMMLGYTLVTLEPPLARRLRSGFDSLWILFEILLFVLLGAALPITVLGSILGSGLGVLGIGILVGRSLGWGLSTIGSNWTWKERLFLLPSNSAKATVQAALGAIPLSQGVAGGETILAMAALSILVTAPLGAWATSTFAPYLLTKGEVDPTTISVTSRPRILVAVDTSRLAQTVLRKGADLARRMNGEVIVLHIQNQKQETDALQLETAIKRILVDIPHRFYQLSGSIPETLLRVAEEHQVSEIVMGKRNRRHILLGSVSQAVLEHSSIPVILVEDL